MKLDDTNSSYIHTAAITRFLWLLQAARLPVSAAVQCTELERKENFEVEEKKIKRN